MWLKQIIDISSRNYFYLKIDTFSENCWWMNESCTPILWLLWVWRYNTKLLYLHAMSLIFSKLRLHQYLSLFFVGMKTNVNYQVVASFVLRDKTAAAIAEAFSVIKTWNPTWYLKPFMVDKWDKDMKSIGNIFLRTYIKCFNPFVLIKNLFVVQNTIHFWKLVKKYQKWFGFGFEEI